MDFMSREISTLLEVSNQDNGNQNDRVRHCKISWFIFRPDNIVSSEAQPRLPRQHTVAHSLETSELRDCASFFSFIRARPVRF